MKSQSELAEEIARHAHEGQYRTKGKDSGKPYIVHPERLAKKFNNSLLKAVCWLHDVLEDTTMTPQMLKDRGIDQGVIDTVMTLTRQPGENYLDFILRIAPDADARPVKIADIEDNMESLIEGSLKDKYRLALYILRKYSEQDDTGNSDNVSRLESIVRAGNVASSVEVKTFKGF